MELIKAFCGDAGPLQVDGDLMFTEVLNWKVFGKTEKTGKIWKVFGKQMRFDVTKESGQVF